MQHLPNAAVAVVLVPLVLWRVYSRIKRLTTRQRSRVWRHRTTLVFFPLLLLMFCATAIQTNPVALLALAVGLPVGVLLGRISIGKAHLEQVGDEFYFTPHAPIGMAVAVLFLGRMAWRGYQVITRDPAATTQGFAASPVTLLTFGILAGYYIAFAYGLLAWRKRSAPLPVIA
jgi:ABC-type nitrate/sulfonate/bicarbonate transport system permease component